jgi:hypothetical protein
MAKNKNKNFVVTVCQVMPFEQDVPEMSAP